MPNILIKVLKEIMIDMKYAFSYYNLVCFPWTMTKITNCLLCQRQVRKDKAIFALVLDQKSGWFSQNCFIFDICDEIDLIFAHILCKLKQSNNSYIPFYNCFT